MCNHYKLYTVLVVAHKYDSITIYRICVHEISNISFCLSTLWLVILAECSIRVFIFIYVIFANIFSPLLHTLLHTLIFSNVDEVVRFSGQAQRRQLTYATKQLIGREVRSTCTQSSYKFICNYSNLLCTVCVFVYRLRWRRLGELKHQYTSTIAMKYLLLKEIMAGNRCPLYSKH